MKIWLTRHGQTRLNQAHLMQGRTDEPLNETGVDQAHAMRSLLLRNFGSLDFDAVYASPLRRAVVTGSIIGGVPEEEILPDERLLEADFGIYEKRKYYLLGPAMTLYWSMPWRFPPPATVESLSSMISRSHAFLEELEKRDYENVLVACHGGILRPLCGYLENRPDGIVWKPKPKNCEVRVYESKDGSRRFLRKFLLDT